MSPTATFDQLT